MAVPKLSFLRSRICCKNLGSNGPKNMHSLEEQFWPLAFTTSTVAPVRIGKTRVAPNNIIPLAMECQVNDEKRQIFPKTKQTWFLSGKLVATYNFAASLFCTAQSLIRTIFEPWQPATVPQLWFLCSRICCKDLSSNGLNNKHSLEEQWLHLASTTSTLAPVRWAKPVQLRRKAKLPLHGGRRPTGRMCHWPWNVKSTIRKAELPQHKPGSPWKNW